MTEVTTLGFLLGLPGSWLRDPWPVDLLSSLNPTFSVKTLHVWRRCCARTNLAEFAIPVMRIMHSC